MAGFEVTTEGARLAATRIGTQPEDLQRSSVYEFGALSLTSVFGMGKCEPAGFLAATTTRDIARRSPDSGKRHRKEH